MHGRVNVITPNTYDLSLFHDKWYLSWGPAPLLFIWPFYLIWGLKTSDVLFTMLGGFTNVILVYLCIKEMKHYFHLSLALMAELFVIISFAFASPNFFLSLTGSIWFTNQIFAITFLLLFYFFFLKYLNSHKESYIILSVVFFSLSSLARASLLFHGLLFIYIFLDSKIRKKKISQRMIVFSCVIVTFFVCFAGFYNYLKFQNVFETGARFVEGSPRFDAIVKSGNFLSVKYVWHNIYYYLLNIFKIDPEGNSVLMVYPSILLPIILFFKRKQLDAKKRQFLAAAGIAALITFVFLMFYCGTGWIQFGNRYFFDVFPLLLLCLILSMPYLSRPVLLIVMFFGIIINFLGVLIFL